MERIGKGNEARAEGAIDVAGSEQETRAREVRALADLELMLVGGGEAPPEWGG